MSPHDAEFEKWLYTLLSQEAAEVARKTLDRIAWLRSRFPEDVPPELQELVCPATRARGCDPFSRDPQGSAAQKRSPAGRG
jgi:hypothetical protein